MNEIKCPLNTYLCLDNINTIYGNMNKIQTNLDTGKCSDIFQTYVDDKGKKQTINTCNQSESSGEHKCNNCDYLFENLQSGDTTCKELHDGLKNMTPDQLKNQIKYNLTQVAKMRIKAKPGKILGTLDWWKKNIWGVNKIQNYIYIVSFAIALMTVIYFIYHTLQDNSAISNMWIMLCAIVFCVLIMVYAFAPVKYEAPYTDPRISVKDKTEYGKNVADNWNESNVRKSVILIIPAIIIVLLGASKLTGKMKNFTQYLLLGYIIAVNMYYTFLIPQFIIMGIILQKIILTQFSFGGVYTTHLYNAFFKFIIIFLPILGVGIVDFILNVQKDPLTSEIDECTKTAVPRDWSYILYYLLLPVSLLVLLVIMFISPGLVADSGWGLFLEPFYNIAKNKM